MSEFNPRCVALEFVKLVENELEFDDRIVANDKEREVATLLLSQFCDITNNYTFENAIDFCPGKCYFFLNLLSVIMSVDLLFTK